MASTASTLQRTALLLSGACSIRTAASRGLASRRLNATHLSCFSSLSSNRSTQQQQPSGGSRQSIEGLRQKNIPNPGTNEDADSAISGFMNMFNDKESKTVSISTCTKHGFVTTEAITLQGPVLCIGGQVFLWDIFKESGAIQQALKKDSTASTPGRSIFEIMDESAAREIFKVFELMNPRPGSNQGHCCWQRIS